MNARPDFQEAMAIGKAIALSRRNRGLPDGNPHKSWVARKRHPDGWDAVEAYYNQYLKDAHYHAYAAVEHALFAHEWEGL